MRTGRRRGRNAARYVTFREGDMTERYLILGRGDSVIQYVGTIKETADVPPQPPEEVPDPSVFVSDQSSNFYLGDFYEDDFFDLFPFEG
jgi:hypothetical protein